MIRFQPIPRRGVILEYEGEGGGAFVWQRLRSDGRCTVSKVFRFPRTDLLREPSEEEMDLESFVYRFNFATFDGAYIKIPGRRLGLERNDVLIDREIRLERRLFAAERGVSIFRRIAGLMPAGAQIRLGGPDDDAIPFSLYEEMLRKFPATAELNRYANARVATIIGEYLDPGRDVRAQYETYVSKRKSRPGKGVPAPVLLYQSEIDKYAMIRDVIRSWLTDGAQRSEAEWQKMILEFLPLIFPKYVAVLENVRVADYYSKPGSSEIRKLDLALVDANGHLDIVEIKKPFDDILLRKTLYRDNHVPTGDLSGTIMQAEKYLFHLSKWGVDGEKKLLERYADQLPAGLTIQITNPKALLILGRDQRRSGGEAVSPAALFDFEIIKRKYANMIDIITYDDLLRRLDRIIAALTRRATDAQEHDASKT